ncbi:uncharacterized protein TRIADDRAFT_51277 [Trichoplax adhaerens]|uniref:Uncharacterized protein n=1 Tax=Trichoplax adhaerens TaxID=10228 RepID=B3RI60_TRIAD|nr:hypothetical protein TRIADDRAFT_51277 [Trichoplax adhaerens]EDV29215.1 hypothetical protein TRIADDRAFT_51277 [Trichoplax adhaerens]|eukprot:XP_002108417.1 hypothetical protein TRIADDRAFT_51277 [Trichoplax adhaerens]
MQPSQDTDKDQKSILNATKVSPPVMIKANEKMKHDVNNKSKPGLANVVSGNEKVQTVSGNTRLLSHLKLKEQQRMTKCAKLVDRFNQWTNLTSEHFLDQSDYLVVGVIGLEGVGKSSIMSRLTNIGTLQKYSLHFNILTHAPE